MIRVPAIQSVVVHRSSGRPAVDVERRAGAVSRGVNEFKSRFRAVISAARSPRAIRDSGQSARSSVREKTTLGMLFIGAA